ncbi:MAG: right-handed parallel beta-helix repeat-containing protein [Actinomycetota bacterium]
MKRSLSAAGRPTVGRALSRRRSWGVVLCLSLVSGLLFLPAVSANATSFVVSTIADEGQGSLRQAILDANANAGADDITFAIQGSGAQVISPQSPLPAITEQVSIDASTQPGASCTSWPPTLLVRLEGSGAGANAPGLTVAGGTGTVIEGFIIRRFSGDGVSLSSPASGTTVTCNAIGTTPDGSGQIGVTGAGVAVRSTDPAATAPTTISGNIIMNNGGPGVLVDPGARSVSIRGNLINANLGVGIDLVPTGGPANGDGPTPNVKSGPGTGGNDLRFTPDLLSAVSSAGTTTVTGSLTVPSAEAGELVVELFSVASCDDEPSPGGFGEGARPIGSIPLPAAAQPGPVTVPFVASGLLDEDVGNFITATATDGFGSGNTSEFSACVEILDDTGTTSADLSVSGSVFPDPASGGGTITYAFTVHDEGPDPAADATLVSELPPGLNLDSMSTSAGSCIATDLTVTCHLGTVDLGPVNDVHVTIVVVAQEIGADMAFDNHVNVRSSTPDPDDSNNDLTVTGTVLARRSDLSIHKTGPAQVASGEAFSYTIDVSNAGPSKADGVTVTDPLPAGVSFAAAAPSIGNCDEDLGTVSCLLGTLAAGASASIDLQVVADAPPGNDPVVVSNTASVESDRLDLDPANDISETVPTTVVPTGNPEAADLELTSVLNVPNPVTGGYDLGSTATVTNLGPGIATGVTLTDTLAPGESFVAAGSDPSCTASAGVVTCILGDLASDDVATVLIVTKTPEVAVDAMIHDAFTTAATEDGTPGNDALDVETAVRARRADFVAGYVPASRSITWLNDATQWSRGDPVATIADPTVAFIGIPGGGPGGPVSVTERSCGAPFACMTFRRENGRFFPAPQGVFGNLIQVSVPSGYGASNPITGIFLDNWSVLPWGRDPFKVWYENGSTGTPSVLSPCGGWRRTAPPCVSSIGRSFAWWNPWAFADLRTVVRFANDGTFGRGR